MHRGSLKLHSDTHVKCKNALAAYTMHTWAGVHELFTIGHGRESTQ